MEQISQKQLPQSIPLSRQARSYAWLRTPVAFCLLCFFALLTACGGGEVKTDAEGNPKSPYIPDETATRGEIYIGADETLRPVARQIVSAFMNLYPDGKITVRYKPEPELFRDLLQDSVRMIIATRDISEGESALMKRDQIVAKTTVLGKSAFVAVVNPENTLDSLTNEDLRRIVRGEVKDWSELGRAEEGRIELVFDDARSGAIRFMQERYSTPGDTLDAQAYAAKGHDDLVEYVSQSRDAIGIVGGAWISDRDEPKVKGYLEKVKIARLEAPDSSDVPGIFLQPYQNEIALDRYPLTHSILAINREHFSGLGTGFVVFAAGEHGQRIILKTGLYPEFPPPRLVVFPED